MAGQRVSRLRRVALTGALAPALVLGAAGFGILPGGMLPTGVTAQSVIDGGSCTAFGAPAAAQAAEMSVADVAEKANPAVVTILNMQPMSQADLSGISGIEGFPGLPQIPGIDGLPGSEQGPDDDGDGAGQVEDSVDERHARPGRNRFRVHRRREWPRHHERPRRRGRRGTDRRAV